MPVRRRVLYNVCQHRQDVILLLEAHCMGFSQLHNQESISSCINKQEILQLLELKARAKTFIEIWKNLVMSLEIKWGFCHALRVAPVSTKHNVIALPLKQCDNERSGSGRKAHIIRFWTQLIWDMLCQGADWWVIKSQCWGQLQSELPFQFSAQLHCTQAVQSSLHQGLILLYLSIQHSCDHSGNLIRNLSILCNWFESLFLRQKKGAVFISERYPALMLRCFLAVGFYGVETIDVFGNTGVVHTI